LKYYGKDEHAFSLPIRYTRGPNNCQGKILEKNGTPAEFVALTQPRSDDLETIKKAPEPGLEPFFINKDY
jgi:hypothetical protein